MSLPLEPGLAGSPRRRRHLRVARALTIFVAILTIFEWPWARGALVFSAAYCALADTLVLRHLTFGKGGRARLSALKTIDIQPGDNVAADAKLALTVAGHGGEIALGISTRRDAYLPMVVVAAVAVAAPGRPRDKAMRGALGLLVVLASAVLAHAFAVLCVFALQMRDVVALGTAARGLLDLAQRTLLQPPANRFMVPLVIGIALAWRSVPSVGVGRGRPAG